MGSADPRFSFPPDKEAAVMVKYKSEWKDVRIAFVVGLLVGAAIVALWVVR